VSYFGAVEVLSQRGAIQIHVYLYLYLYLYMHVSVCESVFRERVDFFHETRHNYSSPGPHETDDISRSFGQKSRSPSNGHGTVANSMLLGQRRHLNQDFHKYFIYAAQVLVEFQGHLKVRVTQTFSGGSILIDCSPWTSV